MTQFAHKAAVYRIESTGRGELRLGLPPETSLEGIRDVRVDDDRASWQPNPSGQKPGVVIKLPPGRRYPVVAVDFETTGQA